MKLTTLMLIFFCLHISAAVFSQQISLTEKKASLETVFNKIEQQTSYNFFFTSEVIKALPKVDINVHNASIKQVLDICFKNLPVTYSIVADVIVIKPKSDNLTTVQQRILIGKITDEKGLPLPGVTIKIKGALQATVTGNNGDFTILVDDYDNAILQCSFIGYVTLEVKASSLKIPFTLKMVEDISKLDEVQVIAYGTTTKRVNTGDITTVDSKTIAQYPTNNLLDALQGTVPGLTIYKNTGNVTGTYKVQIRGINGLNGSSPLYVIDGVPFQGGSVTSLNNTSGGSSANGQANKAYDAMSLINPDDIESVSVLKDADATAIYGSRGADGVILITTKKGKPGSAVIDASVYSGVSDVGRDISLLNLQQYLQMRKEAKRNDNSAINPVTDVDINGVWDTTRSTNWQRALLGGFGHNTKAQLGVSGGTELTQYRISGGYNYLSSLQHLGGNDQTANLNISLSSTTSNKKFTISFTGGYLYDINTMSQADLTATARTLAPDAPPLYTAAGTLNFMNSTFSNPLLVKNYINNSARNNLTSDLVLSYRPITDLEFKVTTGYNKQSLNEFLGSPSTITPPYLTGIPNSTFTYDDSYAWSIEPQVNYIKQQGKGKLTATVGGSMQYQSSSQEGLSGSGYSTDLLLSSLTAGTSISTVYGYSVLPRKFSALFGRVNYSWSAKYYVDLTARDDGSSNFGQNKQFHVFAAAGAGWIFSEEKFVKDNLSFLSFGKLRGSYGSTGRDIITPYSYLSTYSSVNTGVAYGGVPGLTPTQLPNPNLSWETTKKAELGLELQFLQGRIAFETNFYRNRTTGVLTAGPLPVVTGFASINENLPATIQNMGFDVTLNTVNIKSKNISWNTTILFTRDRNKLVDYPGLATSPFANTYVIGQPVNIIKAYAFGGVNTQTGIYQFVAANGSIVSLPNATTDKTVLVNANPDYYGSVQNNISYKQFTLSFLFRYMKQTGKNAFGNISGAAGSNSNNNFSTIVLDRWQKPGDITNIQRYGTSINVLLGQAVANQSNAAYGDASYIRFQNLAFSYSLTQALAHRLGMQRVQLFVQGENLATITGYKGPDPETQSVYSLAPLRVMTAGLRLTL